MYIKNFECILNKNSLTIHTQRKVCVTVRLKKHIHVNDGYTTGTMTLVKTETSKDKNRNKLKPVETKHLSNIKNSLCPERIWSRQIPL